MRVRNLLVALTVLVAAPPLHADDHGLWMFATGPSRMVPFPYVPSVVNGGVEVYYPDYAMAQFDARAVWPRPRVAPWRYAPDPYCQPPVCLPSYWRPIFPWPDPPVPLLPVAAVLDRLKQLDYSSFGPIYLVGIDYSIVALNQHGKPVRLIVNGGNGQIRRILP